MSGNLSQYQLRMDSLFRGRYLRNNKRGGLKHLRCFPECLSTGHHASGFCGHRVAVSTFSDEPLPSGALVVAKFSLADDPLFDLTPNAVVEKDTVVEQLRSKEQPTADFVLAAKVEQEDTNDGRVRTVFHMEQPSWHYGWRSSKHTKDVTHRLYVYLLLPRAGRLICAAANKSTRFKLSSSKRARDGQEPEHQHLSVTSGEIAASIREAQSRSLKKRRKRQNSKKPKASPRKKAKQAAKVRKMDPDLEPPQTDKSFMLLLPSDSEHEDDDNEFMELVYPDSVPTVQSRPRPIEDEDDDMKPLPAQHDDILLEFLGWPKSLQDLGQDDGNGFKFNEPNTDSDFIDPAFFFG